MFSPIKSVESDFFTHEHTLSLCRVAVATATTTAVATSVRPAAECLARLIINVIYVCGKVLWLGSGFEWANFSQKTFDTDLFHQWQRAYLSAAPEIPTMTWLHVIINTDTHTQISHTRYYVDVWHGKTMAPKNPGHNLCTYKLFPMDNQRIIRNILILIKSKNVFAGSRAWTHKHTYTRSNSAKRVIMRTP